MLFEKVAIDPDLLQSDDMINLLHYRFSWTEGRFIVELPKNWIERGRIIAKSMPDGLKKERLKSLLQAQKLPSINLGYNFPNNQRWIDQVRIAKEADKLSAVICNNPDPVCGWFGVDAIDDYLKSSYDSIGYLDIKGLSVDLILKNIDAFIQSNKQIVLVNPDQWLTLRDQTRYLFERFFSMWNASGGCRFTVIRSKRDKRSDDVERSWLSEINNLSAFLEGINYKGKFRLIAVNDSFDRLHDRYLIGSKFGLKLGYGLELSQHKSHPWTLMPNSEHKTQMRRFMTEDIRDSYPDYKGWDYKN
jgi:hypothetical protein